MSKRLQVLVEPREYKTFKSLAEDQGLSLGEWVRQILRRASKMTPSRNSEKKIKNIREFSKNLAPSGDIEQILAQIDKGKLS